MRAALSTVWHHPPSRAVALVFAFVSTLYGTWLARIPEIQQALDLSEAALGWALLGAPVGMLCVMPVAGWMIARWSAGRVTLGAAIAFASVLSAPAWASNGWTLAAGLALIGVTDGVLNVAMNARANAVEEERDVPILSTCHGFFSIGGMIGAGMGSATAALDLPLNVSLLGIGAMGVAVVGLHHRSLTYGATTQSAGPVFALPTRALLGVALLVFVVLLSEGAVSNWSAVYLRNGLGASASVAALGYASFSLTMAIGRFYGDRLTHRFGPRRVVQAGGLFAATGLGGGVWIGHPTAALVGFGLMGLGYATLIPVLFRTAAQTPGLAPGTSLAAVASVGYLGLFAGPPALGGLADAWGIAWVMGLLAALSALVAFNAHWVLPSGQPVPSDA